MFQTIKYKCGYIHISYLNKKEEIRVQVDNLAFPIQTKSIHSAKIAITKHIIKNTLDYKL